jgi:hypothetical protein
MIQINNTSSSGFGMAPTATITVNRNRLKAYGSAVYMKSGTNFEIELYNPLTSRVLAIIELDGKHISSTGIVVNPGQRVYLERWIDESRKFKFSTYEVENSYESRRAIASNGKVKVTFYEEVNKYAHPTWGNHGVIFTTNGTGGPPYYYNNTVTNGGSLNISSSNNMFLSDSSYSANFSGTLGDQGLKGVRGAAGPAGLSGVPSSLETGRAEKGEISNQHLDSTTGDFNTWALVINEIQILPESQKPVEIEKIRSYCTDCGTRVRSSSWKFCPSCGEKL